MKKTFKLSHPKIKYPRLIEAAKNEAKKYQKRERNKPLPKGADFWDFDCKFGADAESAEVIHVAEINDKISIVEAQEWESFYLEIIAVPSNRVFVEREEEEVEVVENSESLDEGDEHEEGFGFDADEFEREQMEDPFADDDEYAERK